MTKRVTPGRARRSTRAMRRDLERGRADIQVGPNLRKKGAVANLVVGVTIGTILFFAVSWFMVYGSHLGH